MGNACGCSDDKRTGEAKGQIKGIVGEGEAVYKIPGYTSKVNPALFAGIPSNEKDAILAEAFRTLITTVEPEKIKSSNPYIRQFTSKTVGKCVNAEGDEYEGEIVEGAANGKGRIRFRNGATYEGTMFNGLKHGSGKMTVPGPQGYTETVECFNDNFVGVTTAKLNDGSEKVSGFDGTGQRSGPVMITNPNGSVLYATSKNGQIEGLAVEIDKAKTQVQVKEYKANNPVSTKAYALSGAPAPAQGSAPQGAAPQQPAQAPAVRA